MSLADFMIHVFCLIDDDLAALTAEQPLRQRGPAPTLADSEVLACEVVGEFLGLDDEKARFRYFRRHFAHFFPKLREVHRPTVTRQAANLWVAKRDLWPRLLTQTRPRNDLSIIDSFPGPVCRFARATGDGPSPRCKRLAEEAAFGYDEMAVRTSPRPQTFYGLRAHVRIAWPGVLVACELAPAHVHLAVMVEELSPGARGTLLGDRNYWSPSLRARLGEYGLRLVAPYKSRKREREQGRKPWPRRLVQIRRRVETVIGRAGRASAREAGAGAGPVAPGEPLVADGAHAHARGGAVSGGGVAATPLQRVGHGLKTCTSR